MKKIFLLSIFITLTGCMNSTAMLGSILTVGTSGGNIYQAGASYGTNMTVKKITGKTPTEHLTFIIQHTKKENEKQN